MRNDPQVHTFLWQFYFSYSAFLINLLSARTSNYCTKLHPDETRNENHFEIIVDDYNNSDLEYE